MLKNIRTQNNKIKQRSYRLLIASVSLYYANITRRVGLVHMGYHNNVIKSNLLSL